MLSMKLDSKLNTGVSANVNKICRLSSISLKRRYFTGKKVLYGTTLILLMYRSAMLHKCKQNITFNTYKKEKSMKKNGWVMLPWRGKFSIIVLDPYSILTLT